MTVLIDPDHRALFLSADMHKGQTYPENIPGSLSHALDMLVARRAGQTGAGAPHLANGYKIRPGSEEHTTIDGQPALRAVGTLATGHRPVSVAWSPRARWIVLMIPPFIDKLTETYLHGTTGTLEGIAPPGYCATLRDRWTENRHRRSAAGHGPVPAPA